MRIRNLSIGLLILVSLGYSLGTFQNRVYGDPGWCLVPEGQLSDPCSPYCTSYDCASCDWGTCPGNSKSCTPPSPHYAPGQADGWSIRILITLPCYSIQGCEPANEELNCSPTIPCVSNGYVQNSASTKPNEQVGGQCSVY